MEPLVCCVGDLVEDIVARTATLLVRGADVTAHVERHRGGSAANTAATVAQLGGRARFVGQIGADETGDRLAGELAAAGVECVGPRGGVTGTVLVVVEPDGERTMFSDRGAAAAFADAIVDAAWLDGAAVVHVPYYAIAAVHGTGAARSLLDEARTREMIVSVDPSSAVLADARFARLVREVEPDIVFCNADEADALGLDDHGLPGARLVVVKRGARPALLRGTVYELVPAPSVSPVVDSTGAGDAFAGGFLLATARGADPVAAAEAGHAAAAPVLGGLGAGGRQPS